MYYKGTKEQCKEYNTIVTEAEEYDGVHTIKWASVVEHMNGKEYAVKAYPDYESSMSTLSSIPDSWFSEEE